MAGGSLSWPRNRELQAAGLGVLTPALLGRANSHRSLREGRRSSYRRKGSSGAVARCGAISANRNGRIAVGCHSRLGKREVSEVRWAGKARNRHHAAVGRIIVVFPSIRLTTRERRTARSER